MAPRKRKKKPLYKQSAKKLALANRRALKKMEAEEEYKWIDESQSAVRMVCFPETSTQSVDCLNLIEPLNVDTVDDQPEQMLNTSNRRIGSQVYISGIYLNLQFYWPQITARTQFYPPFATINYAVVLQKKNAAAVTANLPDNQEALVTNVFVNPLADESTTSPTNNPSFSVAQAPLGNLVFLNMNNGHNYRVLHKGQFVLPAPAQVNRYPLVDTHTLSIAGNDLKFAQASTFKDDASTDWTTHQFSGNACRTVKIRIHPKCKTRYLQVENNALLENANSRPIENGIYLMYWTDCTGSSSRWDSPPGGGTYTGPHMTANWRTRFTDS